MIRVPYVNKRTRRRVPIRRCSLPLMITHSQRLVAVGGRASLKGVALRLRCAVLAASEPGRN